MKKSYIIIIAICVFALAVAGGFFGAKLLSEKPEETEETEAPSTTVEETMQDTTVEETVLVTETETVTATETETETTVPTTEAKAEGKIDTDYYSISIPASWQDKYIYTVALILKKHFMDEGTFAFRLGGDEFAVITVDKDLTYINEKINAINEEIANTKFTDRLGTPFEARIDTGVDFTTEPVNFTELKHNADIRMNDNKNEYYISHGLNRRK